MSTKMKLVGCLVVAALLLASLVMGAAAQEESVLDEILKRGFIRVAIGLTAYPMGFRDDKGNPDGYEVDIAKLLAEKLGVKLEIVEVSGPTRISTVVAKKADIVLSGLTRTLERAKSIAYCEIPYYISGLRFVVKPDSPYKTIEDVQAAGDKIKIGVDRGGTAEQWALKLFPNAQQMKFDSVPDGYLALSNGIVDVVVNDAISAGVNEDKNPDKYRNLPGIVATEQQTAAVAFGDFKWWQWCNLFFHEFNTLGDNSRLYEKWLGTPPDQLLPWIEIR